MKFAFPTVVTLITVLASASAESTFASGGSMNHEDGTTFNHRALRGDAEVMVQEKETFALKPSRDNSNAEGMVKEEESQARTPTRQLADCYPNGFGCGWIYVTSCDNCCNSYHLDSIGLDTVCGPDPSCWGKDTLCVPGISCTKCCNSWSMYLTGPYCD